MSYNREDLQSYKGCGNFIGHVHVSSFLNKFSFPRPFDGDDYRTFVSFLRREGYSSGNISVEAQDINFDNDAEFTNVLSSSLQYMRKM